MTPDIKHCCAPGLAELPLREPGEGDDYYAPGIWHYRGKRERVRVARVWTGYPPMEGCVAIRAHRVSGGPTWTAPLCEFLRRFDREPSNDHPGGG